MMRRLRVALEKILLCAMREAWRRVALERCFSQKGACDVGREKSIGVIDEATVDSIGVSRVELSPRECNNTRRHHELSTCMSLR